MLYNPQPASSILRHGRILLSYNLYLMGLGMSEATLFQKSQWFLNCSQASVFAQPFENRPAQHLKDYYYCFQVSSHNSIG